MRTFGRGRLLPLSEPVRGAWTTTVMQPFFAFLKNAVIIQIPDWLHLHTYLDELLLTHALAPEILAGLQALLEIFKR